MSEMIEIPVDEYLEISRKAQMWDFYSEKADFVVDSSLEEEYSPDDKIVMLTNRTIAEEDAFFDELDEEDECCGCCEECEHSEEEEECDCEEV